MFAGIIARPSIINPLLTALPSNVHEPQEALRLVAEPGILLDLIDPKNGSVPPSGVSADGLVLRALAGEWVGRSVTLVGALPPS